MRLASFPHGALIASLVALAVSLAPAARAQSIADAADEAAPEDDLGEIAHPVDPPPSLTFRTWHWDKTAMYGGPSNAVVAIPNHLPAGVRLPLVVLLPGGHHNMQGPEHGHWGWWSEYGLGDIESVLRRGVVTERDLQFLSRKEDLEHFNRLLEITPYQGAIIITPWVVGRQLDPRENGAMVADFLREVVRRAREELPVIPSRDATGVGGMSSGGLWALYSGSACSDLFGSIVATQPFTEDLVEYLRQQIVSRKQAQRIRMVTSFDDHQRASTLALSSALRTEGIDHELSEYVGPHSAGFAAGPGGIDAMFTFDRWLRGELMDGTRPLPARDGTMAMPAFAPDRAHFAEAPVGQPLGWHVSIPSPSQHRRALGIVGGAVSLLLIAGLWRARRSARMS